MPKKQPGPDIPAPNDLRPNMRDCDPGKGPLAYVKPVGFVMDLGAPRDSLTEWVGVASPASPTFKAGRPMGLNAGHKPEEKSLHIQTGRLNYHRDQKATPES